MTFELQRNRKQHWVAIIQTTVHTHLLQLKRIRRITLTCWRAMYSEQSCHLYDTHSTQLLYIFSISCLSSSFDHHNQTSSHAWRKKNMVLYKGDHESMIECMQNDKQTMRQYCSHFIVTISSRSVLSLHAQYIVVYVKRKTQMKSTQSLISQAQWQREYKADIFKYDRSMCRSQYHSGTV